MLPPLDPTVTTSSPKFEALYRDLCSNKLNSDGSSRLDAKAQKERETLTEELHKARIESARNDLIKDGLQTLSYKPDVLPEELQELIAVVIAVIEGQIADDDRLLLEDDITKFKNNTKTISNALSTAFHEDVRALASMTSLDEQPGLHNLADTITELRNSTTDARSKAAELRLALAQEASALHAVYRNIMESSIRILEQTMHGAVARETKAKAEYLALVAEGMSKKLELQHGQLVGQLYSGEVQEVLQARSAELEREVTRLKAKVRDAQDELGEYKKVKGVEGMAREYAEILGQSEKVRAEIERLQSGRG